jgi:hypothetical protein
MPISLSELQKDRKTVTVSVGEETAEVVYRPSAYTPEVEDEFRLALDGGRPSDALARWLASMVTAWELVDENGEQVPPTYEEMRTLPSEFLSLVVTAISEAGRPDKEARKNSGGGSLRKGR